MTTKNCANGPKLVLKDLCEKSFVRNDWLPLPHINIVNLSISWSHDRPIKSPVYLTSFISGKGGIFEITLTQADY